MSTYIDIHIIQSIPTSNINSGEDGTPKTIQYGGVTRSRVSSQSWKHAARSTFNARFKPHNTGIRTKKLNTVIANYLKTAYPELAENDLNIFTLELLKRFELLSKFKLKNGEFQALTFLSKLQLKFVLETLISAPDSTVLQKPTNATTDSEKELIKTSITKLKAQLKANNSFDIAAFGRLVTEDPILNVDASVQVADAFSVHEIESDYDFFTAIDELKETKGSAMLNTREIIAPTIYRYANINVTDLKQNLGVQNNEYKSLIKEFLYSFVISMPSGKSNQHANRTLPSYVRFDVRSDMPTSAADAFESPIESKTGYVEKSISKLNDRLCEMEMFSKPAKTIIISKDIPLNVAINNVVSDINL